MKIYTNEKGEIKDVNSTKDPSLIEYDLIDATNPFIGWSVAKICCYKVTVDNGNVTMMTPYVDSRLIEHIDQLGQQVEAVTPWSETKTAYIDDTEIIFTNVPQGNVNAFVSGVNYANFERLDDRIIVKFEPLTEAKEVTINII